MSEARPKPRFVPKKKATTSENGESANPSNESVAEQSLDALDRRNNVREASSGDNNGRQPRVGDRKGAREGGRGSFEDRGRGGRGGRGRGNYVSNPSGKAFFSGDSGALAHSKGPSPFIKSESKAKSSSAPDVRVKVESDKIHGNQIAADQNIVSRETIESYDFSGGDSNIMEVDAMELDPTRRRRLQGRIKGTKTEAGSFQYNISAEDASSESDDDVTVLQDRRTSSLNFTEAFPRALTDDALFAVKHEEGLLSSSQDNDILQKEQEENVFLIQMPSGLALPKRTVDNSGAPGDKCGKIGKMQLMSSGRLIFVLHDGTQFEVHRGLATSFSQHLCAIFMDGSDKSEVKQESSSSTRSKISKSGTSQDEYEEGPIQGELFTMGPITAKWTVTPSHDIGELRKLPTASVKDQGFVIEEESEVVEMNELYE